MKRCRTTRTGINGRTDNARTAGGQTRKRKPLTAYYWWRRLKINQNKHYVYSSVLLPLRSSYVYENLATVT